MVYPHRLKRLPLDDLSDHQRTVEVASLFQNAKRSCYQQGRFAVLTYAYYNLFIRVIKVIIVPWTNLA